MIVADTNVLLDVLQDDARWADWSADQLADARASGDVAINAIVIAELSRDYADLDALRRALAPFELTFERIDAAAAFLAGQRFVAGRRDAGRPAPARPLPDFFIGAQAVTLGAALLTRDTAIYRRYFPELTLITPETDHG